MSARMFWLSVLAIVVAMAAALLVQTGQAGAQPVLCRTSGIVPYSVTLVSTDDGAGQVSGHIVRFQFCPEIDTREIASRSKPALKIALMWERAFSLHSPQAAGITLSQVGAAKVWRANGELNKSIDNNRPRGNCRPVNPYYNYTDFHGVTVRLPLAELSDRGVAKANLPLTLQFYVPVSAGMENPGNLGVYKWLIVSYQDFANSPEAKLRIANSLIVPAYAPGELQVFPKSGTPGSTLTLLVYHFKPLAPVQSIKVGGVDVTPDYKMTTDYWGDFELEIQVPGLEQGRQPIEVQMGGKSASADFTIEPSRFMGLALKHPLEASTALGDNFVSLFHYNRDNCRWSFFDPEFPESDLTYLIPREHYWILVKEPAQVILNGTTRNLTCTPEGNCWNRIVW